MRGIYRITGHLFPTKHNGFIPHLLRERYVLGMLLVGILVFSFAQYARFANYFGLLADVYPVTVFQLTNKDRATNNLPALTTNALLQSAAQMKANDMATKGYFAHTSPDGVTPWYWFSKVGYSFIYAGENLAINFNDSNTVEAAWLNSPTHRENIMNKNFTEMGIATATGTYNGKQTTFVVEMFGMPATVTKPSSTPQPTPVQEKTAPTKIPTTQPLKVAGESTSHLSVLKETPTFAMAQNTNTGIEPGNPTETPAPHAPWYTQLVLHSSRIAGLVLEVIFILAIIATAGMVAREYEKHHRKHMAYGALLAVIMTTALFVGGFGFFAQPGSPATATALNAATLQ